MLENSYIDMMIVPLASFQMPYFYTMLLNSNPSISPEKSQIAFKIPAFQMLDKDLGFHVGTLSKLESKNSGK